MNDKSDVQLLRDYAESGSEAAFREIVVRYTNLVYSAALRQVESSAISSDLAQSVFTDLARKAKPVAEKITGDGSLAGWLHRSTRYAALNHLRDARRRFVNERQAMEQLLTNSGSTADWEQIRPALDEALDSLMDEDREALLLRYFRNHDFRAVGLALGVSDDAAQKRVSRAVERLREFFSKRNITIGAGGLTAVVAANAVQAAPVGLAVTISTAALLTGTAVSTSAVIAATKTIAMTTLQKTVITAAFVAAAGAGIFEARQAAQLRDQNQMLQQSQASLADQIQQLQRDREEATNRLAGLVAENAQLQSGSNRLELIRLRGEVTRLKSQMNSEEIRDVGEIALNLKLLKNYFAQNPNAKTPELQFLDKEEWARVAASSDVIAYGINQDMAYRHDAGRLRGKADEIVGQMFCDALAVYEDNNNGEFPTDVSQLKPYLHRPFGRSNANAFIEDIDSILARWEIVPANQVKGIVAGGDMVVTQKAPVDELFDYRVVAGKGSLSRPFVVTDTFDVLAPVRAAYNTARGVFPHDDTDFQSYATTPEQKAAIARIIQSQRWNSPTNF